MLQAQLGLFSSPVEHEKVSVVNAVDQREDIPQEDVSVNYEVVAEETNADVPPALQEGEPVAVKVLMPATLEDGSDAWEASSQTHKHDDDMYGFNDLDDCDIPKNAFAPPKKAKSSRVTKSAAQVPLNGFAQDSPGQTASAHEKESSDSETPVDPLSSDELPVSLWQPRKPVAVAKKLPEKHSFAETKLNAPVDKIQERKSDFRKQDAEYPTVDDLAKHSFGKKRSERSQSQHEKTDDRRPDDRRSRDSSVRSSDREWREDTRRPSESLRHQQRKEAAPRVTFDDRGQSSNKVDSSHDEQAWEQKNSKDKGHKPGKSSWQTNNISVVPDDRNEPEGVGLNRERNHDVEKDWLDIGTEAEQSNTRDSKRNHKQKPSVESKRNEPKRDAKNAFDADDRPARHVREDRESSSRRPKTVQKPTDVTATGTTTQKITVCSWDDAIGGIIEKNMQRRPAPKNDRPSGGRRGPRR